MNIEFNRIAADQLKIDDIDLFEFKRRKWPNRTAITQKIVHMNTQALNLHRINSVFSLKHLDQIIFEDKRFRFGVIGMDVIEGKPIDQRSLYMRIADPHRL